MLAPDSLVTDLMFDRNAALDQQVLLDALGGKEAAATLKLLDADMLGPREMEISPSRPFRRMGERRLMIFDDSQPLRAEPESPLVTVDLRPAREKLIALCKQLPVRLGRLFALGSWGDAVIVAKSARDLRGICLLPWVLDPQIDVDGKRRAVPLTQKEFEEKLMAYEKRLDELNDKEILGDLHGLTFVRDGDFLIVDVLAVDGTWDQQKSMEMEAQFAKLDLFSRIPGAPRSPRLETAAGAPMAGATKTGSTTAPLATPTAPVPKAPPKGPPLRVVDAGGRVLLVFDGDRFDLDVAAALGKRDWDNIVRTTDPLTGRDRDNLHRHGGEWVAPLEFLSEVFVDGKPLNKAMFETSAMPRDGVKALEVHFPRFGTVTLFEVPNAGRFVTSLAANLDVAARAVSA